MIKVLQHTVIYGNACWLIRTRHSYIKTPSYTRVTHRWCTLYRAIWWFAQTDCCCLILSDCVFDCIMKVFKSNDELAGFLLYYYCRFNLTTCKCARSSIATYHFITARFVKIHRRLWAVYYNHGQGHYNPSWVFILSPISLVWTVICVRIVYRLTDTYEAVKSFVLRLPLNVQAEDVINNALECPLYK